MTKGLQFIAAASVVVDGKDRHVCARYIDLKTAAWSAVETAKPGEFEFTNIHVMATADYAEDYPTMVALSQAKVAVDVNMTIEQIIEAMSTKLQA